jgi:AI-2E family transporter
MALIGVLSGLTAWIIGLPSAIALGLIAFAAEFVPYLGPIIAAVPAVLVAATINATALLWTIAAYVIIHQIEGNLFTPLIQRRLVLVPPAVMLLGIVAISLLFGPAAVIFAAPIVVVVFIAVKVLYVRDTLGEDTEIPGESGVKRGARGCGKHPGIAVSDRCPRDHDTQSRAPSGMPLRPWRAGVRLDNDRQRRLHTRGIAPTSCAKRDRTASGLAINRR